MKKQIMKFRNFPLGQYASRLLFQCYILEALQMYATLILSDTASV